MILRSLLAFAVVYLWASLGHAQTRNVGTDTNGRITTHSTVSGTFGDITVTGTINVTGTSAGNIGGGSGSVVESETNPGYAANADYANYATSASNASTATSTGYADTAGAVPWLGITGMPVVVESASSSVPGLNFSGSNVLTLSGTPSALAASLYASGSAAVSGTDSGLVLSPATGAIRDIGPNQSALWRTQKRLYYFGAGQKATRMTFGTLGDSWVVLPEQMLRYHLPSAGDGWLLPSAGTGVTARQNQWAYSPNSKDYLVTTGTLTWSGATGPRGLGSTLAVFYVGGTAGTAGVFKIQSSVDGGAYGDEAGYTAVDTTTGSNGLNVISINKGGFRDYDMRVVGVSGTSQIVAGGLHGSPALDTAGARHSSILLGQFGNGGTDLDDWLQIEQQAWDTVMGYYKPSILFIRQAVGDYVGSDVYGDWVTVLDRIRAAYSDVDFVFIGSHPTAADPDPLNYSTQSDNILRRLAREYGGVFVDCRRLFPDNPTMQSLGMADGIHLEEQGNAWLKNVVSEQVLPLLKPRGFTGGYLTGFGNYISDINGIALHGGNSAMQFGVAAHLRSQAVAFGIQDWEGSDQNMGGGPIYYGFQTISGSTANTGYYGLIKHADYYPVMIGGSATPRAGLINQGSLSIPSRVPQATWEVSGKPSGTIPSLVVGTGSGQTSNAFEVRLGVSGTTTSGTGTRVSGFSPDGSLFVGSGSAFVVSASTGHITSPGLITGGTATPEGAVTASPGTLWVGNLTGTGAMFIKLTGTASNTGWQQIAIP